MTTELSRQSLVRGLQSITLMLPLLVAGCGEEPAVEEVLRPVRYETARSSSADRVRTFAGVARAGVESRLSFRVAGTVDRVPVTVGQRVRKGQVLAQIDRTDFELKVQEALAGLAQAQAALRNSEADYDRVRGLYENRNASRRELDGARANFESSQAQVEAAQKRLEQARQQVAYCFLRAPVDGTVAMVGVEVNENVGAGQQLFLLTAGSDIEVELALPEALIAAVELDQPAEATFGALPGRRFDATVTETGVAAVGTATTFPVTVRLAETDSDIRSGMAAEVELRLGGGDGAGRLMVPAVAVGEDRTGRFVFVLEPEAAGEGVVRRRAVSVGELTSEGLEILSGLEEEELIVTAGVRRLSDGERVKMLGSPS